jgi:feruloyl esterase
LTKAYYQKDIARNYFFGCSRGGGQALMEAQRYPEDFDGIVSGAPAYNWTGQMGAAMTQNTQAMYPDPNDLQEAIVGPKEQELIESSYMAICDEQDGIKDSILNDPRQCKFDVATLLCKSKKTDRCLSKEQLEAVQTYYKGPRDSKGQSLYYGFPFGGETSIGGWSRWITGGLKFNQEDGFQEGIVSEFPEPEVPNAQWGFATQFMKYLVYHDPDWSYKNYSFDTYREDAKLVGETLNATNPDLSAFRKRGGKLLMFTGWSDAAITPLGTIAYYEDLLAHDKSAADDTRLFMMPGVEHCFGGQGPSYVNFLDEIDKWVGTSKAPEQFPAYWLDDKFQPTGSRLICAYPKVANYDGKGDSRDVSSFSCVEED